MIRKGNATSDDHQATKTFKPSSSKSWTRSNDPRIVRVSRGCGGKDRHSKVFTVKGLRDRRIRLSVPTAVHLYDLQERLGLNQPSKVVDWLLDAAKDDIDELPPLQIPQGTFSHNHFHHLLSSNLNQELRSRHEKQPVLTIGGSMNWLNHDEFKNPISNFIWGSSKDASLGETRTTYHHHQRDNENSARLIHEEVQGAYLSANSFFSRSSNASNPPSPQNHSTAVMPYNSFLKWDPSNLTLSQYPPRNQEDLHSFNLVQLPYSALSVPSGSQQVLVYQPPHAPFVNTEFMAKNQTLRELQLSNSSNLLQQHNGSRNERNKGVEFHLQ